MARPSSRVIASGSRWEAEGLTAELFGDEVPAECCVVRGAVNVAVAALDRFCVQHGTDAESRDEGLVSTVAGAILVREGLASRGSVEDLLDVVAVQRARRVHFGRGLGQP